jgi:2-keto-myo-inositol isomerase
VIPRRTVLAAPLLLTPLLEASSRSSKMILTLHQNTSSGAGYRESLEGWSRAGIRYVELIAPLLDEFLAKESLQTARRVLTDLGLTPVSGNCGTLTGVWEPNLNRTAALQEFQRRLEMYAALGVPRVYTTTATAQKFALDDYKTAADYMREVGEIARRAGIIAMVEFVRTSSFISTLPTLLKMTRAAAHPNLRPMLDCYHFWSGLNKLEDLDTLRHGEIEHVHFQDVPDIPRELLDYSTRVIPGDGIAPLNTILHKLAAKGYTGALSVELLIPKLRSADPYQAAATIRPKAEAVMRRAGVL